MVAEATKPGSGSENCGVAGLVCTLEATLRSFVPLQYDVPAAKVTAYGVVTWVGRQEVESLVP